MLRNGGIDGNKIRKNSRNIGDNAETRVYISLSFNKYRMLKQCHKELDGNKAVGIDKVTKAEYGEHLEENITNLVERLQSCDVTPVLALGTIADALFLGSMGMLTSAVTRNTVIGYMRPLLYYALNIVMGPKLGSFYLFSMVTGSYTAKLWLFATGILMIVAAVFYQRLRKRSA